jgi:hypothetical protein
LPCIKRDSPRRYENGSEDHAVVSSFNHLVYKRSCWKNMDHSWVEAYIYILCYLWLWYWVKLKKMKFYSIIRGRCGLDHIVFGFTTTYAISAYHHWYCEFESRSGRGVHDYAIKFVSDLRQVGGFLRVFRFQLRNNSCRPYCFPSLNSQFYHF